MAADANESRRTYSLLCYEKHAGLVNQTASIVLSEC